MIFTLGFVCGIIATFVVIALTIKFKYGNDCCDEITETFQNIIQKAEEKKIDDKRK